MTDPLELILSKFEAAWQHGEEPRIADYLPDSQAADLLLELVHIDLDYRLRKNDSIRVEEYLQQFPVLREDGATLAQLAWAEFRLRRHLRRKPDAQDLLHRFPDLRELLEPRLATLGETPLPEESAAATSEPSAEPSERIGPYTLVERIGEGGMGTVYLADQLHPIRRRVALKIIKRGMDTREVLIRFDAEKQALSLMDHPHIARVLDAGMTEQGQPYFAMEWVQGVPITQYCDDHRLPLPDRLELFMQACAAIQHAHHKGVIHRDIKPSNVLVTSQEGIATVKVIDFGLAKALQSETRLTDGTMFTELGQVLGTFQYMSPEQAGGQTADADTRSDVYGLGVLLYELLTGSTPIERQRLNEMALDAVLAAIRQEDPPRPSQRLSSYAAAAEGISERRRMDTSRLTRLLRGDLDWIVMKALEKDRARRYESAAGFADDVRRFLNNEPIEARPPSVAYRLRKTVRRHRAAVVTGMAFVALLITGTVVSTALAIRARSEARRANSAEELATDRARQSLRLAKEKSDLAAREAQQRQKAEDARAVADKSRKEVELRETMARHHAYAAHLNLAQLAIENDSIAEGTELLARHMAPTSAASSFHSFPWRYLWKQLEGAQHVLYGHFDTPTTLAFSPDGKVLVSGGRDATICVWDPSHGQLLQTHRVHRDLIVGLVFNDDGTRLISASAEGLIVVWEMPAMRAIRQIPLRFGNEDGSKPADEIPELTSMALVRNHVVVGLQGGELAIVDLDRDPPSGHQPFTSGLQRIAIDRTTNRMAMIGIDRRGSQWFQRAKIWDNLSAAATEWDKGERTIDISSDTRNAFKPPLEVQLAEDHLQVDLQQLKIPTSEAIDGEATNDNNIPLSITTDDKASDNPGEGLSNVFRSSKPHPRLPLTVYISRSTGAKPAESLVIKSHDEPPEEVKLRGHQQDITALVFSPTDPIAATCSTDRTIRIWQLQGVNERQSLRSQRSVTRANPCFHPSGESLYAESSHGTVGVWRVSDGELVAEHPMHDEPVSAIAVSEDGHATGSFWGKEVIFQDSQTRETHAAPAVGQPVKHLAFAPGKRQLLIGSGDVVDEMREKKFRGNVHEDGMVRWWNPGEKQFTRELVAHRGGLEAMAVAVQGNMLATAGGDAARVWNIVADEPRLIIESAGEAYRIAFSPDASLVAIVHFDSVVVWRIVDRSEVARFPHPPNDSWHTAVSFTPDGRCLALVAQNGGLQFVDTTTWEVQLTLNVSHLIPSTFVSFSHDGRHGVVLSRTTAELTLLCGASDEALRKIAARHELHRLTEKFPIQADLLTELDRLELPNGLAGEVKAYAIQRPSDPEWLNARSRELCSDSTRDRDDYRRALRWAEEACRLRPDYEPYMRTLGAAQYRVGLYAESAATVRKTLLDSSPVAKRARKEIHAKGSFVVVNGRGFQVFLRPPVVPEEAWAYLAMAEYRSGDAESAHKSLQKLLALTSGRKLRIVEEAISIVRPAQP